MGNLNSYRDWGHAKDYVEMQWLMLQQDKPKDYVIATGKQHSVREFVIWAANALGISIEFKGKGINEVGVVVSISGDRALEVSVGREIIRVNPRYFRPTEVETLLGDPLKAKNELGWKHKISAEEMCREMVANDLQEARETRLIQMNNSLERI